jgi:alanyl-tRNA synthetase
VARELRAQPGPGMVQKAVKDLLEERKTLEKELARARSKLALGQGQDLASQAVDVKGKGGTEMRVLVATLDGADAKTLREAIDKLKDRLKSAAIVLGAVNDGKVSLIAGVTADLTAKVKAGDLVNYVAQQVASLPQKLKTSFEPILGPVMLCRSPPRISAQASSLMASSPGPPALSLSWTRCDTPKRE